MKKKSLIVAFLSGFVLTGIVLLIVFWPFSTVYPFHILCMGDSLTESEFGYYPKHLQGLLKRNGFRSRVQTAARPGNTSGEYLEFINRTGFLKKLKVDLAILMLGTNDVRIDRDSTPLPRYVENMKAIIREVKNCSSSDGSNPVIFIATIPPIFKVDLHTFSEISKKRVSEEINPAIRKIAQEEGINLLQINLFFIKYPELLPGIHPTRSGYYELARFIYDNILIFMEKK
jgi:lysophospholipase L1-like esterase